MPLRNSRRSARSSDSGSAVPDEPLIADQPAASATLSGATGGAEAAMGAGAAAGAGPRIGRFAANHWVTAPSPTGRVLFSMTRSDKSAALRTKSSGPSQSKLRYTAARWANGGDWANNWNVNRWPA